MIHLFRISNHFVIRICFVLRASYFYFLLVWFWLCQLRDGTRFSRVLLNEPAHDQTRIIPFKIHVVNHCVVGLFAKWFTEDEVEVIFRLFSLVIDDVGYNAVINRHCS